MRGRTILTIRRILSDTLQFYICIPSNQRKTLYRAFIIQESRIGTAEES